jgi:hypothetical protein
MKAALLYLFAMTMVCGCASSDRDAQEPKWPIPDPGWTVPKPVSRGEPPNLIFLSGQFNNPGRYPWTNGIMLTNAFETAGGFTPFARKRVTLEHWDGSKQTFVWSDSRPLTNNPVLLPGDSVICWRYE